MELSRCIRTFPRTPMLMSEQQKIDEFWRKKQEEIESIKDFGERAIPMTRLKKVICAEKGSMMMTFDTPSFLTKACEIFVQELAFRAWRCADSHHRCIILDSDIAKAIASIGSYNFLNDVLRAYWEECNCTLDLKPSTKKRCRPIDYKSMPHHPSPLLHQVPQIGPQFVRYASYVPILPFPPTHVHHMPLSSSLLPPQQAPPSMAITATSTTTINEIMPSTNNKAMDLLSISNDISANKNNIIVPRNFVMCNNLVASSFMVPPVQAFAGSMPNIPNTFLNQDNIPNTSPYMNMSPNNVVAQDRGVAFLCPYNLQTPLQIPSLSQTSTNVMHIVATSLMEVGSIPSIATKTNNTLDAIGCCAIINDEDMNDDASNGRQQHDQWEEAVFDHHHNVVHESLDAHVAASTSAIGIDYKINWSEVEISDCPLMDKIWDDAMTSENPPLSNKVLDDDLSQSSDDMLDLDRRDSTRNHTCLKISSPAQSPTPDD
ncbi:hypothetical protein ACP4OV_022774 [Aristida adscensionis]